VRPDWDGGNPVPQPPMHQKAVLGYDGAAKPAYDDLQAAYRAAYDDLQAAYRATQQYPSPTP
jgi:hypothetical protein